MAMTADGPGIYVGTYGKYAAGSIAGKWLNPDDYSDHDEFMKAALDVHADEADPELMFQDFQGFPDRYYGESYIKPELWDWLALDDNDKDMLEAFLKINDDGDIRDAQDRFAGRADSKEDWVQEIHEDAGLDVENYLFVDDVTARMIALEDADMSVGDMSDEEVVAELGAEADYEAAEDKESFVSKAREDLREKRSDEIEKAIIKDAVGYFVDDTGMYSLEDLAKQDFVSIDYESLARDMEMSGDVDFVNHKGQVWVFWTR